MLKLCPFKKINFQSTQYTKKLSWKMGKLMLSKRFTRQKLYCCFHQLSVPIWKFHWKVSPDCEKSTKYRSTFLSENAIAKSVQIKNCHSSRHRWQNRKRAKESQKKTGSVAIAGCVALRIHQPASIHFTWYSYNWIFFSLLLGISRNWESFFVIRLRVGAVSRLKNLKVSTSGKFVFRFSIRVDASSKQRKR